jgi:hypothetical protein
LYGDGQDAKTLLLRESFGGGGGGGGGSFGMMGVEASLTSSKILSRCWLVEGLDKLSALDDIDPS